MINCTFENGNKASLRHVTLTALVVNKEKTQILLIRRAPHLINPNLLAMPGGFLGRDETGDQAVLRELMEESGYKGNVITIFRINDSPLRPKEDRQNVDFTYIVEVYDKMKEHDAEVTNVSWYKLDNLPPENQFAFDHHETITLYKQYLISPFSLPIIRRP